MENKTLKEVKVFIDSLDEDESIEMNKLVNNHSIKVMMKFIKDFEEDNGIWEVIAALCCEIIIKVDIAIKHDMYGNDSYDGKKAMIAAIKEVRRIVDKIETIIIEEEYGK